MRNVSIQCTYKNIPWPNSLLMAQVTGCACVQITGGHVHLTLDYEGNRVSRVCIYEASWKRSLHPSSASLHFSALSWLPLMMSLVVFRLSNLMLLFQTLSSLNSLQRWAVCRPPGACVIFTSLASLSNVSSCLSGVSLCLSLSLVSHPSPPHLTSEYYHFWGTVSALEMLYVQRVNSNLTTLGLSTSVFQEEYYNELVSFSVLRVGRGNGTVRSFDQTIRCSLTSSGLCSNTVFLIKMSRLI